MATQVSAAKSAKLPETQIDTSTEDFLSQGLEELETGDDGSLDSFGGEGTVDGANSEEFDDDDSDLDADAEADVEEELEGDETDEEDDEVDDGSEDGAEEADADSLVVDVTDDQGRRQLKVDLKDTDGIKRYVQQAAGARKLYSKYQGLQTESKADKARIAELTESDASWTKLESIYEADGIEGVVALLESKSLDQILDERDQFRETFKKMSPAEQSAYTTKKITDRAAREIAASKAEVKRMREEAENSRTAGDIAQLEGWAHGEFRNVSFAGKLGDSTREIKLDELMWTGVQSQLDRMEDAGVKLTHEIVRKVVRENAALLGSSSSKAASKKANEIVKKKKEAAKKAAQSTVVRGSRDTRQATAKDVDPTSISGMAALLAGAVNGGRKKRR